MKTQKYKPTGNKGLYDEEFIQDKISEIGNPLEKISSVVDFEMFRDMLEKNLLNHEKESKAGARPYDVVIMFKIMILQRYYGLGDKQMEYQILDRISFKKFLGLESGDKVPDEKTVWLFRENLTKSGLVEKIFSQFTDFLASKDLIMNEGKMVDASFTIVPRQRNTRDENKQIKQNNGKNLWEDNIHKKRQKDIDARWTKKRGENFYGYKNHTKVDAKSKFIEKYEVTDASVHDSQVLDNLLEEKNKEQDLYGDSAYSGEDQEKVVSKYEMNNCIHEKGYRNKTLTDEQKNKNREKSKTRARVEHVFGFMEQSMNGLYIRSIGIRRATSLIGLINLTYNLFRYEQIVRLNILKVN